VPPEARAVPAVVVAAGVAVAALWQRAAEPAAGAQAAAFASNNQ
jgi:hypothetical protein